MKVTIQFDNQAAESVWATDLGNGTYQIDNTPFLYPSVGYKAIVEIDENNYVTNVISSPYRTMVGRYPLAKADEDDDEETKAKNKLNNVAIFNFLSGYMYAHGIECEGLVAGLAIMSVPENIDDSEFKKICSKLPSNNRIQIVDDSK